MSVSDPHLAAFVAATMRPAPANTPQGAGASRWEGGDEQILQKGRYPFELQPRKPLGPPRCRTGTDAANDAIRDAQLVDDLQPSVGKACRVTSQSAAATMRPSTNAPHRAGSIATGGADRFAALWVSHYRTGQRVTLVNMDENLFIVAWPFRAPVYPDGPSTDTFEVRVSSYELARRRMEPRFAFEERKAKQSISSMLPSFVAMPRIQNGAPIPNNPQ
jgi:hypothetical protein